MNYRAANRPKPAARRTAETRRAAHPPRGEPPEIERYYFPDTRGFRPFGDPFEVRELSR